MHIGVDVVVNPGHVKHRFGNGRGGAGSSWIRSGQLSLDPLFRKLPDLAHKTGTRVGWWVSAANASPQGLQRLTVVVDEALMRPEATMHHPAMHVLQSSCPWLSLPSLSSWAQLLPACPW